VKIIICKRCCSKNVVKAGFVHNKQRYKCKSCQCFYLLGSKQIYNEEIQQSAINLYTDGASIRAVGRVFKVSHVTIQRWIRKIANTNKTYLPYYSESIELDELYTYIRHKKKPRWVWIAVCRNTKRILGFQVGSRGIKTFKKLLNKISPIKTNMYFTDKYFVYNKVLSKNKHSTVIGGTNTIEGMNAAIRRYLSRFHRRSVCYSKSEHMLDLSLRLLTNRINLKYQMIE
jgi:insertion element IS1 protein InsB